MSLSPPDLNEDEAADHVPTFALGGSEGDEDELLEHIEQAHGSEDGRSDVTSSAVDSEEHMLDDDAAAVARSTSSGDDHDDAHFIDEDEAAPSGAASRSNDYLRPEVANVEGTEYYERMNTEEKYGGLVLTSADHRRIFYNKYVLFIGDSIIRAFYKDFVVFLQSDQHMTRQQLREKGEPSCAGDSCVYRSEKTNARWYKEVRQFLTPGYRVEFYFATRAYNDTVDALLELLEEDEMKPDLLIMNSCLWDLTRYDLHDVQPSEVDNTNIKQYLTHISYVCERLREFLPASSMFMWLCTLPLHSHIGAGFMTEEVRHKESTLRLGIMEANYHSAQVIASYGFDVLDLHYYMRPLIKCREKDGVHWNAVACRHVSNLILAFVMDAMGEPLPDESIQFIRRELPLDEQNDVDAFKKIENFAHDEFPPWAEPETLDKMFGDALEYDAFEAAVDQGALDVALENDDEDEVGPSTSSSTAHSRA